ncbi:hypothetical protein [Anaerococcus prevotii]|uniref:Uncharacterized protein n=1 Tax=Anaerococcus prevotii ACS-065-V-Col13 TaxID=879305 RepID=F0GU77_9FIRM|nr:hypothetical protein [Anaerococcus prevotii]EGC82569.1 hypothetical protein HMPREF9290_1298 [Anaerococcus prevotii ACS-065-V-Col13]
MAGLINLVSQYSSRLAILPIFAFIMGAISVVLYFMNEKRIVKFVPSIGVGIVGLIIGIISLITFTSKNGLNLAWISIFLVSASLTGIIVAFMVELIVKIKDNIENMDEEDNINPNSNKRVAKKRQAVKKSKNKGA